MKKAAVIFALILAFTRLAARDEDLWELSLEKISAMASIIENHYFMPVEREKLTYASIKGLLEGLDPHSYFLDPDNFVRMREDYTGKFFGLGIQIQKQEDRLVVISAIEGTPAWRLGLQPGDVISHINGESTKPLSSFEALQRLRGEKGTKVNVTIVREGLGKPWELTVIREEIPLFSVPYAFMIREDTGYIFIRNFSETTIEEFDQKIAALVKQGMKSLILDLRGNAGGPLFQSIEISDEFLPKGSLIVSVRGRNKAYDKDFWAVADNQYEDVPLVVLINQGTASASEIVSGAVMDHDRGFVVGEDSWGKGLVQTVFPLGPNMAVALTTARYLTPSGRSIQRDYSHIEDYLMNRNTPAERREVRYTSKGRRVLGQGGISPDFEVKFELKPVTVELMIRGAFFSFARKFAGHQTTFSKKLVFSGELKSGLPVPEGKTLFTQDVSVGPDILRDFEEYLKSAKIELEENGLVEAEAELSRELGREIFTALWGAEAGQKFYRISDPVLQKAFEILPEAARMITRKNSP